jgi:predicted ribosome quality control (RQC) complex YloA/Tae2 family protein
MKEEIIAAVILEIRDQIEGRLFGKIYQLSKSSLAVDFRSPDGRYLFISVEPARPRIYLIARRLKEVEKASIPLSPFSLVMRKHLSGARLTAVKQFEGERILSFRFENEDAVGKPLRLTLVAQLTGKSSNLLILDQDNRIIDTLRVPRGDGQQIGELYIPPPRPTPKIHSEFSETDFNFLKATSVSTALDNYYRNHEEDARFRQSISSSLQQVNTEIAKLYRLRKHLNADLARHGNAETHKHLGDLLLANLSTAERNGRRVKIVDYFDEAAPVIEFELDEGQTLTAEANRRFTLYSKAKRAAAEIDSRLITIAEELKHLETKRTQLLELRESGTRPDLTETFIGETQPPRSSRTKAATLIPPGLRRYRSSDGFTIYVGRSAKDNDNLTFRIARANDIWFHAADYPGSHVVVVNPSKGDIPHRTLTEAAELAAFYSQARNDSKVDVHYTSRKFLSKPKSSPPGQVRLSHFRTITAKPREGIERITI